MMTPAPVVVALVSRKAAALAPSRNSFLPEPRCTGKKSSRYSSMRSWSMSVWASPPLLCTCNSSPGCCLSVATSAAMSPRTREELRQPSDVRVIEADVFRQRVELARDRVTGVGDVRPVTGEDLVRLCGRGERAGLGEPADHGCGEVLITVGNDQPPWAKPPHPARRVPT